LINFAIILLKKLPNFSNYLLTVFIQFIIWTAAPKSGNFQQKINRFLNKWSDIMIDEKYCKVKVKKIY